MKLKLTALLLACCSIGFAADSSGSASQPKPRVASAIVTFTHPAQSGDYFVEAKQPDGTWKEVAKGPTSPISYTTSVMPGLYTIRANWRSDTGDEVIVGGEASTTIPGVGPSDIKIQILATVTIEAGAR
jgi:hypothetical protein